MKPCREGQVLHHRKLAVQAEALRHVADASLQLGHVGGEVVAENAGLGGMHLEEPRDRPEEGRLPGPVRTDDAEDLALVDREIDAAERGAPAVALLEAAELD